MMSSNHRWSALFVAFVLWTCQSGAALAGCPAGSQLFAYGSKAGCVNTATKETVRSCFRMPGRCPTGWLEAGTAPNSSTKSGFDRFCCPPAPRNNSVRGPDGIVYPLNTCVWRGTAPFCNGQCNSNERPIGSSKFGRGERCVTGSKTHCCQRRN